jgi:hypothetical protein
MSMRRRYQKLAELQDELYMLHFAEPSQEVYKQKRSEIEYKIACLEERIEFEQKMKPFRITLIAFVIIVIVMVTVMSIIKS